MKDRNDCQATQPVQWIEEDKKEEEEVDEKEEDFLRTFTLGDNTNKSNQETGLLTTKRSRRYNNQPNVTAVFEVKKGPLSEMALKWLPWSLKESESIDSKARQYWHDYDLKNTLLHKYKDTHFPQVEALIQHWNITSEEQKKRIKEQYILLEKGNKLNHTRSETGIASASTTKITETPDLIRYRWRDTWQVARVEASSDKTTDTERILELENHEKKQYMLNNHPWSCQCRDNNNGNDNVLCSCLYQRLRTSLANNTVDDRFFSKLPDNVKAYLLLHAISEHEQDNGDDDDDSTLESSMVGESFWTAAEKRRFFIALDRCGRHDIAEISKRVGPTKTIQEVIVYLNLLETLSKANPMEEEKMDKLFKHDPNFTAREMSPLFIMQEEQMADKIIQKFETESFEKHLELVMLGGAIYEKPLEFFELWNMSSLTRLFTGTSDMTVLSSTIVQYYELIRYFIHDIITILYTEMSNEADRIVTKKRINQVIAKRRHIWRSLFSEKQDTRLKHMDIMGALDRKRSFHEAFSRNKAISFLAKKRQRRWIVKKRVTKNSDSQEEEEENHDDDGDDEESSDDNEDDDDDKEEEEEVNSGDDKSQEEKEDEIKEETKSDTEEDQAEEVENASGDQGDLVKDVQEHTSDELHINIPAEVNDIDEGESSDQSNDFNEDDTLDGSFYRTVDSDSEDELTQRFSPYEYQLYIEQIKEKSGESDDNEIESRLTRLDKKHEKMLSKQLGFITSK